MNPCSLLSTLLILLLFDLRSFSVFIAFDSERTTTKALKELAANLTEDEHNRLVNILRKQYRVQEYDEAKELLRNEGPQLYSIISDMAVKQKKFFESRYPITIKRMEIIARNARDEYANATRSFTTALIPQIGNMDKVIRKEFLFYFLQVAHNIREEEIRLMRKAISSRFYFTTVGAIFGEFERAVPAMYDTLLTVSETLASNVGNVEPGTPGKYINSSSLSSREVDLLMDTFSTIHQQLALVLCSYIVQGINAMGDEEYKVVRGLVEEDLLLSTAQWPASLGVFSAFPIVRMFAWKFNTTTGLMLNQKVTALKKQVLIDLDEDQQGEFIERLEILSERIHRFLVQFGIISLVESTQKLSEYDVMLLRQYVVKKAEYVNFTDVMDELMKNSPTLYTTVSLLKSDMDEILRDRLVLASENIEKGMMAEMMKMGVNQSTLLEDINTDLATESFTKMHGALVAFSQAMAEENEKISANGALRMANENWRVEIVQLRKAIHQIMTKHHRPLLRVLRREMPTVYSVIGPYHKMIEEKKKKTDDVELQNALEVMRAESVRLFVCKLVGEGVRDQNGDSLLDFFGRHFNIASYVRGLSPEQLEELTEIFNTLTPEQIAIFESLPVFR